MAVETDFNMKTVLHDIANLITPFSNFPERIGDVTKTMEVTLRHLRQVENEIERNMEDIGEFLKKIKGAEKYCHLCKRFATWSRKISKGSAENRICLFYR